LRTTNGAGRHYTPGLRPASDQLSLRLTGGPYAAAEARRAVARLGSGLDSPQLETLQLLVTELVANSVRHAGPSSVDLQATIADGRIWLQVTDHGPGFDPIEERARAERRMDGGWGLLLVERLADRWGVGAGEGTTSVWFELRR
jgi:anti-sigma regulatory factor (Ser/Thr protein kinase)